ncbi:MAG: chromosomal replication initiator DnaA [Sphingomonadales bacterium]|nr:MAG: chromosomal replication initiator DnaA [Sphingomonadales bacterium]TNF04958.1 MAG: chromosomal replication initiator DnaA [Sphingomonadales bacterium]
MSQIGLPFDWEGQAQADNFLIGEANHLALRHVEQWRDWPIPISILSGPARSGKSTLGRHFIALSDGEVIDDAERQGDEYLFHQWNIARDSGRPLLLIAQNAPTQWNVTLPDLRSRLAAAPHIRIAEPDDMLVRQLIETGLARAGSAFSPDVPEWLARRIERSYAAVADLLVRLNSLSLAASRKISVPMLKEALQISGTSPIIATDSLPEQGQGSNGEEER